MSESQPKHEVDKSSRSVGSVMLKEKKYEGCGQVTTGGVKATFFKIGKELLDNVVLVSAIQQCEVARSTHVPS